MEVVGRVTGGFPETAPRVRSCMRFSRTGDLACYVGPDSACALGPWRQINFCPQECDRISDVLKWGVDMETFSDHLRRLSLPMSKAFGWVPLSISAGFVACVFGLGSMMLLSLISGAVGILGLVLVVFGPICAAFLAFQRSASTVREAVTLMQAVVSELNQELHGTGLCWESWEHVEVQVKNDFSVSSNGTPSTKETKYHCWSLAPIVVKGEVQGNSVGMPVVV